MANYTHLPFADHSPGLLVRLVKDGFSKSFHLLFVEGEKEVSQLHSGVVVEHPIWI